MVRRRGAAPLQLGFAVRAGASTGLPGRPGVDPAADVALTLSARSARIDWAAGADYFPLVWPYFAPDADWAPPRLLLNRPIAGKPYAWAGWNRVRWHERRKAGWRTVARAFAAAAR